MRALLFTVGPALLLAAPAAAQHEGHDMSGMVMDSGATAWHVMVQAIPLVTRASPSAGGGTQAQFVLSQALGMMRGKFLDGHAALDATLNAEGLTMRGGELNTGAAGEGFVDKRHPHTYLHELMLSGLASAGPVAYSLSAGRGFAPFGTDDPMVRPLEKYPLDPHLAQILERATAIGSARMGPVVMEGGIFDGDEPTSPSSLPRIARFGDSWAARATLLPLEGAELQGSYARVASPEQPDGNGLDQRKQSVSARLARSDRYALAEWSRTTERDATRATDVFSYSSLLVEGSVRISALGLAARLEQADRPEEDRLADPFRTPRPAADLSINGITRWRVATMHVEAPAVTTSQVSGFPFLEIARLTAAARDVRSVFTPEHLYGTSKFWMITAGIRVAAGMTHDRMGRYGVANAQ